jgi:flagellin
MGISINTNIAATRAGMYLSRNHEALQKSMDRLSSGRKITNASDDAGGLAVSMKLESTTNRLRGASSNVSNAISFLQVQDGLLESAANIVARMGELKGLYADVLKSSSDQATYNSEFSDLQDQLYQISQTKFNGVELFDKDGLKGFGNADQLTKTVSITEDGSSGSSVDIHQSALLSALSVNYRVKDAAGDFTNTAATDNVLQDPTTPDALLWSNVTTALNGNLDTSGGINSLVTNVATADWVDAAAAADAYTANDGLSFTFAVKTGGTVNKLELEDVTTGGFTLVLENLATLRATNGGQVSRLQYAQENLQSQTTNLQAAVGRIVDVDIATESANLAKQQILVQAAASMTSQANMANEVALMLLR